MKDLEIKTKYSLALHYFLRGNLAQNYEPTLFSQMILFCPVHTLLTYPKLSLPICSIAAIRVVRETSKQLTHKVDSILVHEFMRDLIYNCVLVNSSTFHVIYLLYTTRLLLSKFRSLMLLLIVSIKVCPPAQTYEHNVIN